MGNTQGYCFLHFGMGRDMKLKLFKVSEITSYIKNTLKTDIVLNHIYLEGELGTYSHHVNGHVFFTLKDEFSKISCIMFASDAMKLNFELKEGMKVEIKGRIDVYSQEGRYQIIASSMSPSGLAEGYQQFLLLKEKLQKQGYFDLEKKKVIRDVKRVGIITSERGAAIRDFLSVLNRRNPFVDVFIYPTLVQGENAPVQIARGIEYFNAERTDLDAIVISRGGGSKEDLSAFNTEIVADAVYASVIPVMSAVGHEVDTSICDMCADFRAATPTEAAEYISGNFYLKLDFLSRAKALFDESVDKRLEKLERSLKNNDIQRTNKLIYTYFESHEMKLKNLFENMSNLLDKKILKYEHELALAESLLSNFTPQKLLEKGYTLVKTGEHYITKSEDLQKNQRISIVFCDGTKDAVIVE